MSRWAIVLVVGCVAPARAPITTAQPLFTITAEAFGPLTAKTQVTLVALRAAFAGYDVAPHNQESLEYVVSVGGTTLCEVVPDEAGAILGVHVVSPEVAIGNHAWRVGAPFTESELVTTCECWGAQTVCFKDGERVAVALSKTCREGAFSSRAARRALANVSIRAAIWSPRPLVGGGTRTKEFVEEVD